MILPALYNAGLAFFKYDALRHAWQFVGVQNFVNLWRGTSSGTRSR